MTTESHGHGRLKLCQCGSKAEYMIPMTWHGDSLSRSGRVKCQGLECGIATELYFSEEEAVKAWNTRPRETELKEALKQARAVMLKAAEDKEDGRMWNISYPLSAAAAKITRLLTSKEA